MRGDEHERLRRHAEQVGAAEVGLPVRLVVVEQFGGDHAVPRQTGPLGHVDQQRHVAVGKRCDGELFLQPRQSGHGVRPRVEPVPRPVELVDLAVAHRHDPGAVEEIVEDHAVQVVDSRPRSSPRRTRSIAGAYPARQSSAKRGQSCCSPWRWPNCSSSRMTLERQSTTVPNTSNANARRRFMAAEYQLAAPVDERRLRRPRRRRRMPIPTAQTVLARQALSSRQRRLKAAGCVADRSVISPHLPAMSSTLGTSENVTPSVWNSAARCTLPPPTMKIDAVSGTSSVHR